MLVGLNQVDGKQYYFSASGAMQTGWQRVDGNWYYFQADGSLLKNSTTPDGYKVNEEGIWKQVVAVDKQQNNSTNKQETSTLLINQTRLIRKKSKKIIKKLTLQIQKNKKRIRL